MDSAEADLLIVGGGINGAGIARDAAGRGLGVVLAESHDLGGATSSASSKLVHGGLRYLEQLELRLVAESLAEREILLRAAPHIVRPMRFVMPRAPGLRPGWLIRAGLYLYDWLARRDTLERSRVIDLTAPATQGGLKPQYTRGYAYADCWVDDARLVIANVLAAAEAGARILTHTAFISAAREGNRWKARLVQASGEITVHARALVNAAGPWVEQVLSSTVAEGAPRVKLVQGSHILLPRLYGGDHAYILQNEDRRVVFAYPYESDYTLVGTTDVELTGDPRACRASPGEIDYLCRLANRYFRQAVSAEDVRWSYCGVRALVDDGAAEPSRLTRDYLLHLDGSAPEGAPLLSIFGGKITTYRRLAERALEKLVPWFPDMSADWTAAAPLPGGEMSEWTVKGHAENLARSHPDLPVSLIAALVARHGSRAATVLGGAQRVEDLGEHFGADLYAREVDYFLETEWARDADDILWRRTKCGLRMNEHECAHLSRYTSGRVQSL